MPDNYSTTPGGTVFGTTPGGTKIVYERAFLVQMRNSPLARTPPKNMPSIPGQIFRSPPSESSHSKCSGITTGIDKKEEAPKTNGLEKKSDSASGKQNDDDQFSMDI